MTVLLNNNFDGGAAGSNILTSNSGADNGNAFTYINTGNGGTAAFCDVEVLGLNRNTAQYVVGMSSGASTGATTAVGWTSGVIGTLTTFWTRFYVYFSSFLANTGADTNLFSAYLSSIGTGAGVNIYLSCNPAPPFQLYIWNDFSQTFSQMTTGLVAGVWNRVEFTATLSTTVGTATMSLYADPNADGVTPTETVSQTAQNYGTSTMNQVSLGMDNGWQTNTPTFYFSNWQFNNTGYPGPAPFRPGKGFPGILPYPIAIHSDVC